MLPSFFRKGVRCLNDNSFKNSEAKKELKETKTLWSEIYEWVDCAVITVVCLLLIFTFAFRQVQIDGDSMKDTLLHKERVLVSNVFYTPKNGDIVVISSEIYDNVPIIKRVIATEGQWVNIVDGKVFVGDSKGGMQLLDEEYIDGKYTETVIANDYYGHFDFPLQVPENKVFLLGDNREVSLDSRTRAIGLVDENQILGKALYRVYPFEKIGSIY